MRTLIIFASLLLLLRLLGKRQLRELELSELVVSVMVADLAANPLQDIGIPLLNGLIPIVALFACELILSGGILVSPRFRSLLCGKPSLLIVNGQIQEEEMRRSNFSVDELMEELRSKEILDLRTVKFAVLETDGSLSTILYPADLPVTAGDMGISKSEITYPVILVDDGTVLKDNLKQLGKDKAWLDKTLKSLGPEKAEEIFALIYYGNGDIYRKLKEVGK